jgi:hypothetical protein
VHGGRVPGENYQVAKAFVNLTPGPAKSDGAPTLELGSEGGGPRGLFVLLPGRTPFKSPRRALAPGAGRQPRRQWCGHTLRLLPASLRINISQSTEHSGQADSRTQDSTSAGGLSARALTPFY